MAVAKESPPTWIIAASSRAAFFFLTVTPQIQTDASPHPCMNSSNHSTHLAITCFACWFRILCGIELQIHSSCICVWPSRPTGHNRAASVSEHLKMIYTLPSCAEWILLEDGKYTQIWIVWQFISSAPRYFFRYFFLANPFKDEKIAPHHLVPPTHPTPVAYARSHRPFFLFLLHFASVNYSNCVALCWQVKSIFICIVFQGSSNGLNTNNQCNWIVE